jgi:thioredoxin reductase (NADPH)
LVILGSGPAGLTAAIYAARAGLDPLVLAGSQAGGQLLLTSEVENYPGFPEGIQGPELISRMRQQAERFGARFADDNATRVDLARQPFVVATEYEEYRASSIIVATGAQARWLGVPGEEHLIGHGVSSCATCDGFFFRGKEIIVVGGGDSALEEALFLTRFASKVTIVHRRDELRGSKIMQGRALKHEKIEFIWNSVIEEVLGAKRVESVRLANVKTGEKSAMPIAGIFVAIGYVPATSLFAGQLDLDKAGYIVVRDETRTSVDGVFVAGDVEDHHYRQAVTAAGAGCKAALDAEKYLDALGE